MTPADPPDGPGEIRVQAATMTSSAAALRELAQTVISAVRDMDSQVSGLEASWRGPAASAFTTGWTESRDGAVSVLTSLESMADLLGLQAEEFDQLDESIATTVDDSAPAPSSLNLKH